MTTVSAKVISQISRELARIGYGRNSLQRRDYAFAEFARGGSDTQRVSLAAFTDTPASYRTAAIGVIDAESQPNTDIRQLQDLGAPLWLCVRAGKVEVWLIRGTEPHKAGVFEPSQLAALFSQQQRQWNPEAARRAKHAQAADQGQQMGLSGFDLLTTLEGNVAGVLDRRIRTLIRSIAGETDRGTAELRAMIELTFVMISAKILIDREHEEALSWNIENFSSIFNGLTRYYGLNQFTLPRSNESKTRVETAWLSFYSDIRLENISGEDLAFVYENTLVAPETRRRFGTHSTPKAIADYVVREVGLSRPRIEDIQIYEPFCGAAVLLVAAATTLRARLPQSWSEQKRHTFLSERIRGADIDAFAREVARLSLILCDYPNRNGWRIETRDLLDTGALEEAVPENGIVLCNPPFADFTEIERESYPALAQRSVHKPIAILRAVLTCRPSALGFVLPQGFLEGSYYRDIRKEIASCFDEIDLVSLPDRVFAHSTVESSLLIAKKSGKPIPEDAERRVYVTSRTVADGDRSEFLSGRLVPEKRARILTYKQQSLGDLWTPMLNQVWDYLEGSPLLGEHVEVHRGIEWNINQTDAYSSTPKVGFRAGHHQSEQLRQFEAPKKVYLDCDTEHLRGGAMNRPWNEPKIIANAARLSRGPWRLSAWIDHSGCICSQQFMAFWRKEQSPLSLQTLCALLNSPVGNAFATVRMPKKRFILESIKQIPLPRALDDNAVRALVDEYQYLTTSNENRVDIPRDSQKNASDLLFAIDAELLSAYDLPPKTERQLLDFFSGYNRPASPDQSTYYESGFKPYLPLREYLHLSAATGNKSRLSDVLQPLPREEAAALAEWL